MSRTLVLKSLLPILGLALLASAVGPHDRLTWALEILPLLIIVPALLAAHRRFPLTTLLYILLTLQGLGLILGAHYSFPRVPPGEWLQDWLDLSRNHYDRFGHFLQGVVPALLAREILIRLRQVRGPRMLGFLCFCVAMAVSAVYELIEWGAALAFGRNAADFLGMQGDRWDAQADMLCALAGALFALTLLAPLHDRGLARLGAPAGARAEQHRDSALQARTRTDQG